MDKIFFNRFKKIKLYFKINKYYISCLQVIGKIV